MMKKIMFFLMASAFTAGICGCAPAVKYAYYSSKDPDINVTMDYIAGWQYNEQRGSHEGYAQVLFYEQVPGDKGNRALMAVNVRQGAQVEVNPSTAEVFMDYILEKRLQFKEAKVLSKTRGTLLGVEAFTAELSYKGLDALYRVDSKLIPLKEKIVVLKKNGKFFTIRYQNSAQEFNRFNNAFSHILGTIKLIEDK